MPSINTRGMIGEMRMVGFAAVPGGWLLCDGAAVSRTTYSNLFNKIGTNYGVGDGATTFNLPEHRGRSPIGSGTGPGLTARAIGSSGGEEAVVITTSGLPPHRHTIHNMGFELLGNPVGATNSVRTGTGGDVLTEITGAGDPVQTMHPFLVNNYIIKY